ncbi:MAG TPA: hypothetical protein VKH37_08150 [Ferruginibacter sp.]|nr:hypothetical protein [Ferruginibacter sp.]
MQHEEFSPQESLKVIQNMLAKSREDFSHNDIYFLVWGWITLIACTGQFVLKHIVKYEQHYQVWWLVVVGVAFTIYYSTRVEKKRGVKTYVSESMKYLWIGMGISYFVLSMIFSKMGYENNVFPFYIMLYGLGTFVSGCFLQFKPLVAGGIMAWALAIGAAFVEYDYQMLFAAVAILVSYIIPAYMLRNKVRASNN